MRQLFHLTLIGAVILLGALHASAKAPWVTQNDFPTFHIVTGEADASAAADFQHYWEATTGHRPEIVESPADGVTVWLGAASLPEDLKTQVDLTGLGEEGLLIKTLDNGDLLIAGESSRGTLNGVYEFFDRFMGVRWLTPDTIHIPDPPASMTAIDYRYVPPFTWRWSNNYHGQPGSPGYQTFERAHHYRSPRVAGTYGHNFYQLVPPPKYFPEHPEYFGMNEEGERVAWDDPETFTLEWGQRDHSSLYQLCMTNPDVPELIMNTLRRWNEQAPDAEFSCVMQEDIDQHCMCPVCSAIDEREGTPMGSMLTGINRIADLFAEEFPDKYILTYAYAYTRNPPKHLEPRDNIFFQLCTIECDFLRPLRKKSTEENKLFMRDLKGWSKLTDNFIMYDYAPNFTSWMRFHPNFHVIVPNLKTYTDYDALGAFVQGDPQGTGSLDPLRNYLIVKGLWNPDIDHEAVKDEFLELYYQEAAPYIDQYIDLMTETALEKEIIMTCFDDGVWIDAELVAESLDLINQAMAAAQSDTIRERIRAEWLRIQYNGLTCTAKVQKEDGRYILERPAEIDSAQFYELAGQMGIRQLDEQYGRHNVPLKESVEEHMGPLGQRQPKEIYSVVALENDRYQAEVAVDFAGAIVLFRDKESDMKVFRGEPTVAEERWTLQEWYLQAKGDATREAPLRTAYEIIDQGEQSVTIQARLDSGLVIERTTAFESADGPLQLHYLIRNEGAEPIVPTFKLHPEFWTQGEDEPQIWLERDGAWQPHPLTVASAGFLGGGPIEAEGISRWAARIPGEDLTITMGVQPDQLENLFYFFNTRNEHVNLELVPDRSPLQPGEQRALTTSIALSTDLIED